MPKKILQLAASVLVVLVSLGVLGVEGLTVGSGAAVSAGTPPRHASPSLKPAIYETVNLCQIAYVVNELVVTRSKTLNPEVFTFPRVVKVTNVGRIQAAARALCSLPVMPKGITNCPMDVSVNYVFRFDWKATGGGGGDIAHPVVLDAGGCAQVTGLGEVRQALDLPSFWRLLGGALGLQRATGATFAGRISGP